MSNTPLIGQHLLSSATIPLVRLLTMDLLRPSSVKVRSSSSAAPLGPAGSRKRGKPVGVVPHYLIEPVVWTTRQRLGGRALSASDLMCGGGAVNHILQAEGGQYHVKPAGMCRYLL